MAATAPAGLRPALRDGAALSALAAAILASRLPGILSDYELNVDESQLIAQVRRYWLDWLPWRSVNGDTGGPLNTWYLVAAHWAGMPLEYAWVHALSAGTLALTVVLTVLASRRFFGPAPALLGGILAAVWVCGRQETDFVQYASELVPILLVAGALVLAGRSFPTDLGTGFLLGLMPWAKLQVVPLGLVIGAWMVARTLWPPTPPPGSAGRRVGRALLLVFVAALPSILLLAAVVRGGAWEECRQAYFVTNLSYAGEAPLLPLLRRAFDCVVVTGTTAPWFLGLAASSLLVPWRAAVGRRLIDWRGPGGLVLGVVAASVYAWSRTPSEWAHYDFFLLPGLILATAAIFAAPPGGAGAARRARQLALVGIGLYAACVVGPAIRAGRDVLAGRTKPQHADSFLAAVRTIVPAYRTLDVWGWRPSVYVRGHLTPSTRQANCSFLFVSSPSRDYLRRMYAADLTVSLPEVLVDSAGMGFEKFWHGVHALEVPEVAQVIRAHYVLRGTLTGAEGTAYIYTLRPR